MQLIIEIVSERNPKDDNNSTPLHKILDHGHFGTCKLLIDSIVDDINPKDNSGMTALMLGAKYENLEILDLMSAKMKLVTN